VKTKEAELFYIRILEKKKR